MSGIACAFCSGPHGPTVQGWKGGLAMADQQAIRLAEVADRGKEQKGGSVLQSFAGSLCARRR